MIVLKQFFLCLPLIKQRSPMHYLLIISFALFSLIPSSASAKKIYKHSTNAAPRTLAPLKAGDTYSNEIITAIYDTLYEYKYLQSPWELKPNLAAAMPTISPDGLTYTIPIKQGVRFIDDPCFPGGKGREVVAQDFIYSLKRHFNPQETSYGSWLWQGKIKGLDAWAKAGGDYNQEIEGLRELDNHTIKITLTRPYPQFIYTLAMGYTAVMAKEAVDKYGKEIGVHPVGSGPFMLKSFNTRKAVLVKNPNYRDTVLKLADEGYDPAVHGAFGLAALDGKRLPIVDQVEINFFNAPLARWNSLNKKNEIDFGSVPLEAMKRALKSKKPITLTREFTQKFHHLPLLDFGFVYNNFNMADPEIGYNEDQERNKRNRALRQAIRKGFDWNQRIRRFYMGIGKAYPGIIPPGIEGYDPTLSDDGIKLDLQGAKKLLRQNGWNARTLPILSYHASSGPRTQQFFEQFRGWMKKIGYPQNKIKLKTYATFGDYAKAVSNKECMFYGMGWALDYPDAQNVLQLYYGPHQAPGSNGANFNNPEYNALYEKSSIMQPGPERAEIYKKMNRILLDEVPVIAGYSRTAIILWKKDVTMYYRDSPLGNIFKYVDVK